jgi:hypothetical protein
MVDTHVGTATTNTTPGSVAKITVPSAPKKEKSGSQWVSRYPGSVSTSDLSQPFGGRVDKFIAALNAAGASVSIAATLRPSERAYLMHYSWEIVHGADPTSIPAEEGVDIDWAHLDRSGKPDLAEAESAAQDMVGGYGLGGLNVAPALTSRHIEGNAIDMTISWSGTLSIADASNRTVAISTSPSSGMNQDLVTVGNSYGVIKFVGGDSDKPHWSNDGH